MEIVKYKKHKHKEQFGLLLKSRGLSEDLVETLPKNGILVYINKTLVAAGFLRLVEPNYGIYDSIITNPLIDPETRHTALDELFRQLFLVAQRKKVKHVLGFTLDKNTGDRAIKHGFRPNDSLLLIRSVD